MSRYNVLIHRDALAAARNRGRRAGAVLYAADHPGVARALRLAAALARRYPDRDARGAIRYGDSTGFEEPAGDDVSLGCTYPGRTPADRPAGPVVAWVELVAGGGTERIEFAPDRTRLPAGGAAGQTDGPHTDEVTRPDDPAGVAVLERFLTDRGWACPLAAAGPASPPAPAAPPAPLGVSAVLAGRADWALEAADCLAFLAALPDASVGLVLGSPPYAERGERYAGGRRRWDTDEWVGWMLAVTREAVRVSAGDVLWVANGAVRGGRYLPACEGLVWEWHRAGGVCERPAIWHKNSPPNRRDWFGNDWEFVLAFRRPGGRRTFRWEAIAEPPKYTSGGRFRQRTARGERRAGNPYPTNPLARPRDVFRVPVGGGQMGSPLAHRNEAPYPERLVAPFVAVQIGRAHV